MLFELKKIQHINFAVPNYQEVQEHFFAKFGAELNWELLPPNRPDRVAASLITLGPQLFEVFGPEAGSRHGLARVMQAKGPGFIGMEFGVADLQQAREAIAEHGIGIMYEPKKKYYPGTWFVTEPSDLCGLALECYVGDWYTQDLPLEMKRPAPPEFWTNEHPLGIKGLRQVVVGVEDAVGAADRWKAVTGAAEARLSGYRGDSFFFTMADTAVEFVGAAADPDVAEVVKRRGDGIYAVAFRVKDPEQVASHLQLNGVPTSRLDDHVVVAPAEANHGVRLEFVADEV